MRPRDQEVDWDWADCSGPGRVLRANPHSARPSNAMAFRIYQLFRSNMELSNLPADWPVCSRLTYAHVTPANLCQMLKNADWDDDGYFKFPENDDYYYHTMTCRPACVNQCRERSQYVYLSSATVDDARGWHKGNPATYPECCRHWNHSNHGQDCQNSDAWPQSGSIPLLRYEWGSNRAGDPTLQDDWR